MKNIINAEEIFEKALHLPSYGSAFIEADAEAAYEGLTNTIHVIHLTGGVVIVSSAFIDRYPFIEGITGMKGVTKIESDHSAIVFIEGETENYVDRYGNTVRFEMFTNYETGIPPVISKINIIIDNDDDNISRGWAELPAELKNLITR